MANEPVTITKSQIQYLAELILDAANAQTVERMVTTVDESSDDYHVPTAKAVNSKIENIQKYSVLIVESGDPNDVEDLEPDDETLYMVQKSADSESFVPYIWTEGIGFITMPGTEVEESSGVEAITDEELATAVAAAASSVVVIPTPEPSGEPADPTDPDPAEPTDPDPTDPTDPDSGDPDSGDPDSGDPGSVDDDV